ncbi:uncharacterized protein LOC126285132 [Schistocerca gregaria]|uniref:uncharacterized protein LOC126285132 n=1 Tax=Schistocerca gregaria TaxID=7010 RepID=UPI00211DAFCF|nr:uncharacterized protein LOC126285132 [Schistocerca gregaria]
MRIVKHEEMMTHNLVGNHKRKNLFTQLTRISTTLALLLLGVLEAPFSSDFLLWKRKIRDLIDYHEGALDIIDSNSVKPEPLSEAANEAAIKDHKTKSDFYLKANSYSKSMIKSAVTDTMYQKIMNKEMTHEAWEGEDISTHIVKLTSLWNELNNRLKAKGETVLPDLILVCKALHILPESFDSYKSSWMLLTKDDNKMFDELKEQLCMFERNFTKSSENIEQEALVVKSGVQNKIKTNKFKVKVKCNYCNEPGYWIKYCKKWFADGRPVKNTTVQKNMDKTVATSITIYGEACSSEVDVCNWWIGNGATKHTAKSPDYFVSFEESNNACCIKATGQESLEVKARGSVRILSTVDSRCEELTLTDAWNIPKISKNRISVLAAQDQIKPLVPEKDATVNLSVEDRFYVLQLYHERWGHEDKRHIKITLKKEFNNDNKEGAEICEPCKFGEAHHLPFGTRESYGYFAAEKSELSKILRDFRSHTKALGYYVKEMLSDNGNEFDNKAVRSTLSSNCITQRLTVPYPPKQNAIYILNRTGKSSVEGVSPYELWERKKSRSKHFTIIGQHLMHIF